MKITCITLFDITATGVKNNFQIGRLPFVDQSGQSIVDEQQWRFSRNQQRNWETLQQVLAMRTQPLDITDPIIGEHHGNKCWKFRFSVDPQEQFLSQQDPLSLLKNDCQGVPMLRGLTEQADLGQWLRPDENIWFELNNQS